VASRNSAVPLWLRTCHFCGTPAHRARLARLDPLSPSGGQNRPPSGTTTPKPLRILPTGRAGEMTGPGLGRRLPVPAAEVSLIVLEQPAFRAPPI
jgi:hypothetical protein